MTTKLVRRLASGSDFAHLVRTAHWEGNIDGNPYGLCGVKVPVTVPDDDVEATEAADVCPDCQQLSEGKPLDVPEVELGENDVTPEELTAIMADTTGRDDAEILAELRAQAEPVAEESAPEAPKKRQRKTAPAEPEVAAAENEGLPASDEE